MKTCFVPIESAIGDFLSDFALEEAEIDEELLKRWGKDAVEALSTDEQLLHKIALIDVNDCKATLPDDFVSLCEIAYRLDPPEEPCPTKRTRITKFVQDTAEGCELEISVRCPKCYKTKCTGTCGGHQNDVIVDVDRIWEMANSHYYYPTTFMSERGVQSFGKGEHPTSMYSDKFLLMRPNLDHNWFQLQHHVPNCMNLYCHQCHQTYSVECPNIEVSFEKGEILVAYMARAVDNNGIPLIPDHREAFAAVTDYFSWKWSRREWRKDLESNAKLRAMQIAKSDYYESLGAARSALQIPDIRRFNEWVRNNKFYKVESAYMNLINGCLPVPDKFGPRDKYTS